MSGQYCLVAAACVALAAVSCAAQGVAPLIVDNGGPGFSAEGNWNSSTRDKGFEGQNYFWHRKGSGEARAVFTPNLPEAGVYEIFVKWVASKPDDRATNAPFIVEADDRKTTVRVDMSVLEDAARWISLGLFRLPAGKDAKVVLSNDADNSVVADAVKFVPVTTGKDAVLHDPLPDNSRLILSDGFDAGLANWVPEGPYTVAAAPAADGALHVKTSWDERKTGQYVWCRRELPADFRVEFDFTPVSESGFFLLFFCAEGVNGEDILAEELFDKYMPQAAWKPYEDFE